MTDFAPPKSSILCNAGVCAAIWLAWGGIALAGERIALPGSDATVEAPRGWAALPMMSDPPSLRWQACDPATADGCRVLAEMDLERLAGDRVPASLEAVFRGASTVGPENPAPAQRIEVAGHDAVETVVVSPLGTTHRALTLKAGSAFYRCGLSASPKQDPARWRPALIEFCSSLQFADAKRPIGKK